MRAERSDAGSAQGRGYPSPRAAGGAPRSRSSERDRPAGGRRVPPPAVRAERDDDWGYDRDRGHDRGHDRGQQRTRDRELQRSGGSSRRPAAPVRGQRDERPARPPVRRESDDAGPHLRGSTVVLGMFALTLAAAAVDSYIGVGLGMITLVALLVSSVVACLRVRRRDLLSVVVAPPLVFLGVAMANIALAPSATFSLPTIATLLIRGFPAMGLAVAVSLVLFVGRRIARR